MNVALLDPAGQDYPETIEDYLEEGIAVTCAFNRRGSLLAVGCIDGRVVIWDFDTRGTARFLVGHVQSVTSVCWSRGSRRLASSSIDFSVILWDVSTCEKIKTFHFGGSVMSARIHPRDSDILLVCPLLTNPVLVFATKDEKIDVPVESEDKPAPANTKNQAIVATFDKRGEKIYTGNPRGTLLVIDTATRAVLNTVQVSTGTMSAIKSIEFSKRGDSFIINSADRNLRLYDVATLTLQHRFQDLVNRVQWRTCRFSSGSDYIIAGSAQEAQHHIYIWNTEGTLIKILEGPKDGLLDVVWHPIRPIIASVSTFGSVFIWSINYTENWSAFAPDFKELEENVEYIERENEFDDVDELEQPKKHADEDENVDIVTVDPLHFGSSDEEPLEEEELVYLPVHLEDGEEAQLKAEEARQSDKQAAIAKKSAAASAAAKRTRGTEDEKPSRPTKSGKSSK